MRYMMCGVLLWLALPAGAYNETVSAISYNPSRMGAYTHLKITQGATLKGGLNVPNGAALVFKSKDTGTVTIQDEKTCEGNASACNKHEITFIKPANYFVSSETGDDPTCPGATGNECNGTLKASRVLIQGQSDSPVSTWTMNDTVPTLVPSLDIYGGEATVGADSYIATISNDSTKGTVQKLTLAGENVKLTSNLYVRDSLKLGNITIKRGVVTAASEYQFIERTTKDNEKYYVLAVK